MRIVRRVLRGVALTTLALAPAREASACSCMPSGPPCQNTFIADAVFAGTVRTITPLPDDRTPFPPGELRMPLGLRVEFADVVAFRGVQGAAVTVQTASSGASCGYAFKQGERYLVYAYRMNDGSGLQASMCSRTRPLSDAAEDVRFLQTLTAADNGRARIYGTVIHGERDLGTGTGTTIGPVSDVIVSARAPGATIEAITDAAGKYEMNLPPGKYEVTAMPPAAFSARYLQQTVELRDSRACYGLDFGVRFDGRISGLVRHASGEPAANASVQVMSADSLGKAGFIDTLQVQSDGGGRFEFTDVSPGRYVVGVDLTRRMGSEIVFPTTFYPGGSDAASATIVELKGGERRQLDPLTVPAPRPARRLTGTVVFADGSPAAGAFISLFDGAATWRQVAVGIKTAADGSFSFIVHEGFSYIANGSYWDEGQRKQNAGTVGPFVVSGAIAPLRVVIAPR